MTEPPPGRSGTGDRNRIVVVGIETGESAATPETDVTGATSGRTVTIVWETRVAEGFPDRDEGSCTLRVPVPTMSGRSSSPSDPFSIDASPARRSWPGPQRFADAALPLTSTIDAAALPIFVLSRINHARHIHGHFPDSAALIARPIISLDRLNASAGAGRQRPPRRWFGRSRCTTHLLIPALLE
jgi:hypothetical protein